MLARIEDPAETGGFVDISEVVKLPLWERNSPLSAGKQIRRHVGKLEKQGYRLIEGRQKVFGPFRLAQEPGDIVLDCQPKTLKSILGFTATKAALPVDRERKFYQFVRELCAGSVRFNAGDLANALTAYERAAEHGISAQQQAVALQNTGRILERLGKHPEALDAYRKALDRLKQSGGYRDWTEIRSVVLRAWVLYKEGDLTEAERLHLHALSILRSTGHLRILGDIYNGLGEIRTAEKQYDEALSYYHEALEHWILSEYFYGVQAIYFNIGLLNVRWAEDFEKRLNAPSRARERYQNAITWLNECISLCSAAHTGQESSEAEALLSRIYLRLGQLDNALRMAETAKEIAMRSGHRRSLGMGFRALFDAYCARKELHRALAVVREAYAKLGPDFGHYLLKDRSVQD